MIKRIFSGLLFFVLLLMFNVAFAATYTYSIKVYRDNGSYTTTGGSGKLATTGIQYMVLTAGATTIQSIYSDVGLATAKTNPIVSSTFGTDDGILFYADTATVDIIITDEEGGFTTFLDGASASTTHVFINEHPGIMHHGITWYNTSCDATNVKDHYNTTTVANGNYDTGINFPVGTFIHDVLVQVISADAASQNELGVGLGATFQGLVQAALTDRVTGITNSNAFYGYSDTSWGWCGSLLKPIYASNVEGAQESTIPMVPYRIVTACSLNYGMESYAELTLGETTAYDSMGWGFIHYWFVPAMSR